MASGGCDGGASYSGSSGGSSSILACGGISELVRGKVNPVKSLGRNYSS